MTFEQFAYWLQEFADINGSVPTYEEMVEDGITNN